MDGWIMEWNVWKWTLETTADFRNDLVEAFNHAISERLILRIRTIKAHKVRDGSEHPRSSFLLRRAPYSLRSTIYSFISLAPELMVNPEIDGLSGVNIAVRSPIETAFARRR